MLLLIAQARPPGPDAEKAVAAAAAVMTTVLIVAAVVGVISLLVGLVIKFFFCRTLVTALNRCAESNRQMSPGMVWLFLIPCLDAIWGILLALWVPASLEKEFRERGMHEGSEDYGKLMGLLGFIGGFVGLGMISFVLVIIFWVKVAGFSAKLEAAGAGGGGED